MSLINLDTIAGRFETDKTYFSAVNVDGHNFDVLQYGVDALIFLCCI